MNKKRKEAIMVRTRNHKSLSGKRIGFLGKGGAGKSTVAVVLAMAIRDLGYHACLLDADSTNIGLAQALGFDHSPETLLKYFGGMVFSGGVVTCPVDDPTPLPGADIYLDKIPPQFFVQEDGLTLLTAGKIGALGPGAGCDGPIAKIARDLKIHANAEPVVTLVDFKAGFEDTARGAITSLDWAIVVVDPTLAALEMASEMYDMVARMKALELPATLHLEKPELVALANKIFIESRIKGVFSVLNKVQNKETQIYLTEELLARSITPIGTIYEDPSISIKWLKGKPLAGSEIQEEALNIARVLETSETYVC
jgi:CO dehydrogenase nickel-insertion accessory protein CooC1